jgi:hypothetical protein
MFLKNAVKSYPCLPKSSGSLIAIVKATTSPLTSVIVTIPVEAPSSSPQTCKNKNVILPKSEQKFKLK